MAHTTLPPFFLKHLTPKNFGQWGCSSEQFVAHVLFLGPWTSLRGTQLPKTTLCGIPRCVVWCVVDVLYCVVLCCGVVCRCGVCSKFSSVRPKFGRSPDSPPPDRPKFLSFFPLPPHFHSLFLLWVVSLNVGGVIEGWDPQMCMFGLSGCRVKPRRPQSRETSPKSNERTNKRGRKNENSGGKGKKRAKLWAPTLRGSHDSGPHLF